MLDLADIPIILLLVYHACLVFIKLEMKREWN